MRAKFYAITLICAVDAFFVCFAIGFNSKQALVEDPSLPPITLENDSAKNAQFAQIKTTPSVGAANHSHAKTKERLRNKHQ